MTEHTKYVTMDRDQLRDIVDDLCDEVDQLKAELETTRKALDRRNEEYETLCNLWSKQGERIRELEDRYKFQENERLCIGYPDCEGDLVATPHDEGCPARAKDAILNPHLYGAVAEKERS